jgi:5-methylcytosine-specific restriction endonuclease McrA
VLERDRHACTKCGSTDGLEVHHVIPAAAGGATSLENLETLCVSCHLVAEAEKPTDY